jgi:hypothetical protein
MFIFNFQVLFRMATYLQALQKAISNTGKSLGLNPQTPLEQLSTVAKEELVKGVNVAAGAPVVVLGPNGKPVQGGNGRRRKHRKATKKHSRSSRRRSHRRRR